jgi:membrane protease YdiL (CAAX protease family)
MATAPAIQLAREMFSGDNRRPTIALITSAVCLSGWNAVGNYSFWLKQLAADGALANEPNTSAAVASLVSSVVLLGIVPLLVTKFVIGDRLSDYGIRWGSLRLTFVFVAAFAPLIIAIGYFSAQSPEIRQFYPLDPHACRSASALTWHLVGQLFWYAGWEFHFRGFLQHAIEKKSGLATGICVQTLASTLAHFGHPSAEVFGAIAGGLLWGALAWRTRSILAGFCQHWLLGASLDFFIFWTP